MTEPSLTEVPVAEWDALLYQLRIADPYLLRAYVKASSIIDDGEPVLLHMAGESGDVVFACLVRSVGGSEVSDSDVTTPYGYGGPVGTGPAPPWTAFHAAYAGWCSARRIVSTFLRYHPLFENSRWAGPDVALVNLGHTVAWRLDEGELLARIHKNHLREIRRATAEGLTVRITNAPESLTEFVHLYEITMTRRHASEFYFFPASYWDSLLDLEDKLVLAEARSPAGETVASVLLLAGDPWIHYHLGASTDGGRMVGANHFLLSEVAAWARGERFIRFHLGGGLGGAQDGLFRFKRRFDPEGVATAFLGKQINDAAAYRRLAPASPSSFFPAYRERSHSDAEHSGSP